MIQPSTVVYESQEPAGATGPVTVLHKSELQQLTEWTTVLFKSIWNDVQFPQVYTGVPIPSAWEIFQLGNPPVLRKAEIQESWTLGQDTTELALLVP